MDDEDHVDPKVTTIKYLSKTGLYAPLKVLYKSEEKSDNLNSSSISTSRKQLTSQLLYTSSFKDHALIEFLHQIGKDYHQRVPISTGKNCGCRNLSQSDIQDRIKTKTLTLLGGGIHSTIHSKRTTIITRTTKMKGQYSNTKRKKYFRKHSISNQSISNEMTWDKLVYINSKWNQCVNEFLQQQKQQQSTNLIVKTKKKKPMTTNTTTLRDMLVVLTQTISQWELVGSMVRLSSPKQQQQQEQQKQQQQDHWGILVGETKNTWRIVRISIPSNTKSQKPWKQKQFRVMTVPKCEKIMLEICVGMTLQDWWQSLALTSETTRTTTTTTNFEMKDQMLTAMPKSTNSFFICIR
jgi:hypothetical protein